MMTVNSQLCPWNRLPHSSQRLHCQIHAIPVYQRAMIHDHEWPVRVVWQPAIRASRTKLEDRLVRRVHDDVDLRRGTTSRSEESLTGAVDCDHHIGDGNTPLLEACQHWHQQAIFRKIENRHHELGHWIVQIQDDLCSEPLRYQ